jgi:flagellar biosynthesis protein FlhB
MADDDTERTEEPTPERRRKAREEGQFPRAKDAGNIVASVLVMLTLAGLGESITRKLADFTLRCFSEPYELLRGDPRAVFHNVAAVAGLITDEWGLHSVFDLEAPDYVRPIAVSAVIRVAGASIEAAP